MMKFLGFVTGLAMAIAIWAGTFLVVTRLVDQVPLEHRDAGGIGGLGLLAAGAVAGRRVWRIVGDRFEQVARAAQRRRARRRVEILRLLREKSQVTADQRWLTNTLHRRLESAQIMAESMPSLLEQTQGWLRRSEENLAAGVYGPFWDAAQGALTLLATFVARGETLIGTSRFYQKEALRLAVAPASFSIGPVTLPDARPLVERLNSIIRRAHERHEFSVFYEMRRNDMINVPGFGSFSESLQELPERLEKCLAQLPPPGARMKAVGDAEDGSDLNNESERMRYLQAQEHKLMA
jgi:hypothetical protein